MEERKEEQERSHFQEEIKYLLSKEIFTMKDFHERITKSLQQQSSLKTMFFGTN